MDDGKKKSLTEWEESQKNNTVEDEKEKNENSENVGRLVYLSLIGVTINAGLLSMFISAALYGSIIPRVVTDLWIIHLLPIVGGLVSAIGVVQNFPLWVWYTVAVNWLTIFFTYIGFILYISGRYNDEFFANLKRGLKQGFLLNVLILPIIGLVVFGLNYPLQQAGTFLVVVNLNVFAIPLIFLTSVFNFSYGVWIIIVIIWIIQLVVTTRD